jgi:hypothetical protein
MAALEQNSLKTQEPLLSPEWDLGLCDHVKDGDNVDQVPDSNMKWGFLKIRWTPGVVVYAYNSSYLGGGGRRILVQGWPQAKA